MMGGLTDTLLRFQVRLWETIHFIVVGRFDIQLFCGEVNQWKVLVITGVQVYWIFFRSYF